MRPQCDHREPAYPTMGGRRLGRRCTRRAAFKAYPKNGEGSGLFCSDHLSQRSGLGMVVEKLPVLGRCDCCVGDTPHSAAQEHKRKRSRCTRTATIQLRKAADRTLSGKPIPAGPWGSYCELCAQAIEAYQGDIVERRKEEAAA
jgi:hypothetical protein